ncbi:hypothetical protein GQ53DRAFT_654934 [Thozetella sp. PMI_491]|nr:hypothetical protein GQ53DRAFT_654934 [Thozetella sp. PMI_491]
MKVTQLWAALAVVSRSEAACSHTCAQNALAFAYSYGYGFYPYGLFTRNMENPTANTLYHQRDLAKPGSVNVVRPNADTVYTVAFYDVSSSDLVLSIPKIEDRYWVFPFYDPYGDNLVNLGSISNSTPGEYLIRYDPDNVGLQTENVKGGYQGYVNLAGPYAISMTRILVRETIGDIVEVRNIQNKMNLTERLRFDTGSPIAPPLNLSLFTDTAYMPGPNTTLDQACMKLAARLAPYNPPYIVGDRSWIAEKLSQAGMSDGHWIQPEGTNLTAAVAAVNASITAFRSQPGTVNNHGNNWTSNTVIGKYDSYYQMRYYIAFRGYLALTNEQTTYPSYPNIVLNASQAALFSFNVKPKITSRGFWSLTVYGEDQYLIPNDLSRYSIGDRSNMTLSNGQPLASENDGPFQILMQGSDIPPPKNWTNNWLPSSAGGGTLTVNLRWYGAETSMTNGSYIYPKVTIIDAIRT